MKEHIRHNWLLGLYCAAFLYYSVPASAAPSSTTSQLTTDNSQVSITKRSTLPSDFQDAIQTITDCDHNPDLCTRDTQTRTGQTYDISGVPDEENHLEMVTYNRNILPYNQNTQTRSMDKYEDDGNQIPDAYRISPRTVPAHEFSQTPKIVILALPKISSESESREESPEDVDEEQKEVKKKNIFTSRGWGAGGMPFSVLYLHQQHHVKPVRSPIVGAQQLIAPQPLRGYPSQYRQVAVRNALSSALTAPPSSIKSVGGGLGAPLPTRRQYSIIPQLYVSYGWGPQGK